MFEVVEQSVKHFFENILKNKLKKTDKIEGELYGSSISLNSKNDGEFNFYLFFPKEIFEKYRNVFLKNVILSEDDWCDLSKEFANEIVGHAKMKLNEKKGDEFSLGIPEYLGRVDFAHFKLDKSATFDIEGSSFRIGYKKDE